MTTPTPPSIDAARTWVVSDTHFGHKNIVGYSHRPTDHDALMQEEWARFVPDEPDVTLLHLGDLSWKNNGMFKHVISKHLTPNVEGSRKLLIRGNHDNSPFSFYKQSGFKQVRPFYFIWTPPKAMEHEWYALGRMTPRKVSFSHYPWNEAEDGRFNPDNHVHIHGHIHNNGYFWAGKDAREWSDYYFTPFARGQINLSVEQTKYRPVNLEALLVGYWFGADAVNDLFNAAQNR